MQNADGISDRLDGAVSFREPFSQTKVMQILQGAGGDTDPPGGDNPWSLLFFS